MLEIEKKSIADAGQRREMHSVECDPDAFAPRRKHEMHLPGVVVQSAHSVHVQQWSGKTAGEGERGRGAG